MFYFSHTYNSLHIIVLFRSTASSFIQLYIEQRIFIKSSIDVLCIAHAKSQLFVRCAHTTSTTHILNTDVCFRQLYCCSLALFTINIPSFMLSVSLCATNTTESSNYRINCRYFARLYLSNILCEIISYNFFGLKTRSSFEYSKVWFLVPLNDIYFKFWKTVKVSQFPHFVHLEFCFI